MVVMSAASAGMVVSDADIEMVVVNGVKIQKCYCSINGKGETYHLVAASKRRFHSESVYNPL